MLKANIGWSTEADNYKAGKDAAAKAVVDLMETKVALLYTSSDNDVDKVLEGAISEFGTAPIIGCTSSGGIIVPDGYISSENGFVGTLAIGDPDTTVGVAGSKKVKSARETGRKVAIEAMKKAGKTCPPAYFYMVANPAEEEDCLKGIEDVIGRVPFFGGSAAAIIAPKYGIKLNNPIINPNSTAYFTPIMDIAIDTKTPIIIPSKNWVAKNLKNISFDLLKYSPTFKYVSFLNITLANFFKKFKISVLSTKIYIETTNATKALKIPLTILTAPFK